MMLDLGYPPLPGDPGGGIPSLIDGTYTGPSLPRFMDPHGDHGPLVILRMEPVSGKMPDHPFVLRQSIEKCVGGKIEGAIPEAQGRTYALKVRSRNQIAKLLAMTHLKDGTMVKVTHHSERNSTRCVISCRDLMKVKEEAEILDFLKDQNVTDIRRITRRTSEGKEPTPTVILTVSGTIRPEHVDIGYQRIKTRPYYPAPMMCYQCYQFGHTKLRCKQDSTTCGNCGQMHVTAEGERCVNAAYCSRCNSGDHPIGSRRCPVYITEDNIQHIRIDQGIQYHEARKMYEANTGTRSFAGIATLSKDKAIEDLKTQVHTLSGQVAERDATIKGLQSQSAATISSNITEELQLLKNVITQLKTEIESRDQRIRKLEDSIRTNSRMDIVREHGTIADLIDRVAALESSSTKKDEEILALRKENEAYRKALGNKIPSKLQKQLATKDKTTTSTSINQESAPNSKKKKSKKSNNPMPTSDEQYSPAPMDAETPLENTTSDTNENLAPKKTLCKQFSDEIVPKRPKSDLTAMYISDSEDTTNSQTNIKFSKRGLTNDPSNPDNNMEDDDGKEELP